MVAGQEEANILLSLLCTRLQLRLMSLSRERSRPRGPLSQVHSTLTRTLHTQRAPRVSPYIQLHPPHAVKLYAYLEPRHGRLSVYNLRQVQRHDNATVHHGADDENIPPLAVPRGGR